MRKKGHSFSGKSLFICSSPCILACAILGLALAAACNKKAPAPPPPLPTVKVRLASDLCVAGGGFAAVTLSATQKATISTRLAAPVRKIRVSEGQAVKAGELLVILSDEDLQGNLRAAKSAVETAQANLKRLENLGRSGIVPQADIDMAKLRLAEAKSSLTTTQTNIAYMRIAAPFAGTVQKRLINDGDFVGAGMPLIEMEGKGALEWVGSLTEAEAKSIKIGDTLSFQSNQQRGKAEVTALATGSDALTHRLSVRARVIGPLNGLKSGDFGRLMLPVPTGCAPGIYVNESALVSRSELNGVFVVSNGKAELRWLSLGEKQGTLYSVRAGLREGERVIDKPGDIKDGQPVEVTP